MPNQGFGGKLRVPTQPSVVMTLWLLAMGVAIATAASSTSTVAISELFDNAYAADDWNRRHEAARAAIEAELINDGYDFTFRPHPNVSSDAEAYDIMKRDAETGTQLFIIHNTKFVNATARIAKEYSDMKFLTTPSVGSFGNHTYQMYGYLYQATWLGGIACGLMTKTNKVGVLSMSTKRGQVAYSNSFLLGVKHVNPSAQVYIVRTDAVADPIQEKKGAEILAKEHGTDCHLGGTLSAGFKVWSDLGLYSIGGGGGYDRFLGTDNTLFGTYYDFTSLYRKALYGFANGSYPEGKVDWTSLDDGVKVGAYSPIIPPYIKRRLADEYNKVVNGTEKIFCGQRLSPPRANASDCLLPVETRNMAQWHPSFINPRNVTYNESIEFIIIDYDHALAVSFELLSAFTILAVCVPLAVLVLVHREKRTVKIRSPIFLLVILFGCVMMLSSIFTFFGRPTVVTCQLRHWLFCLGYAIAVGAMVAKNVRIWILFKNSSMKIIAITNLQLFYGVGATTAVMILIMAIWSGVTPYVPVVDRFQAGLEIQEFNIRCLSTSNAPAIAALVFGLLLLVFGYLVTYQVREVGKKVADADESKQMGYALSVTFIFGMAMLVVQFVNAFVALTELVIFSIVAYICPVIITAMIVGPVAWKWNRGTLDKSTSSSTTAVSNGRQSTQLGTYSANRATATATESSTSSSSESIDTDV